MILFIFIPRTSEDANPAYDIPAEQQKMWTASRQLWSPRNLRPLMSDMFQKLVKAFAIKPETSPSPETVIVAEYGGECSFLGRQVLARSTCINKCCFLVALGVLEKCGGGGRIQPICLSLATSYAGFTAWVQVRDLAEVPSYEDHSYPSTPPG